MKINQINIGTQLDYNVIICVFDKLSFNTIESIYMAKTDRPNVIVRCRLELNNKNKNKLALDLKKELNAKYVSFAYSTNQKF